MKTPYHLTFAMLALLPGVLLFAGGIYGPTVFHGDVSIATLTNAPSVVSIAATDSSVGCYTNGVYTNYYRLCGTNLTGRLSATTNLVVSWTGAATSNNAVLLTWTQFDGISAYVVERSYDSGSTWTNWTTVSPASTSWIDYATNTWTASTFESVFSLSPAPSVPWETLSTWTNSVTVGVYPPRLVVTGLSGSYVDYNDTYTMYTNWTWNNKPWWLGDTEAGSISWDSTLGVWIITTAEPYDPAIATNQSSLLPYGDYTQALDGSGAVSVARLQTGGTTYLDIQPAIDALSNSVASTYLPLTGGTLSGGLTLGSTLTLNNNGSNWVHAAGTYNGTNGVYWVTGTITNWLLF